MELIDSQNTYLTDEQTDAMEKSYMTMLGFAWTLYEKDDIWYIVVRAIEDLERQLITRIRVTTLEEKPGLEDLHIDLYETNFSELDKYKLLYYTERNRSLLLEAFLGKYEPVESEEHENYRKWVNKE